MLSHLSKAVVITRQIKGYTLIELMIVVMIVAILAAIALPSYKSYARKAAAAQMRQEILKLADQLEKHKARNFSYQNFSAGTINLPATYSIEIKDGVDTTKTLTTGLGQKWVIKTVTTDPKNYNFLMTSTGLRCMTTNTISDYTSCGTSDYENW